MKKKFISKISLITLILTLLFFNVGIVGAYNKSQSELLLDQCYENLNDVTITENETDVTNREIEIFKDMYESQTYEKIKTYLRDNNLSIGVVVDSPARAMEGKIFKKLYPKSGSTNITLLDGTTKKISISWDILVTCSYSVNVQTEKISSLSVPKISLDKDIVPGDTQNLQLVANKTNATKTNNDTWISLDISYSIKTKHYYFPFQNINLGPYTIKDTIK